ncbi:MAG: hypothetical protein IKG67_15300 [Parasporobacterium sp.]|nr:hypothetical protein [Parasporobacterium sp.]
MKKKAIGFILCLCLGACLFGTSVFAASSADQIVTIGKIPAECTINKDENNFFVKGLLDDSEPSFTRAGTSVEEVEDLLGETDNEILMFPAKYQVSNTPYYMYTFVTDGYTNLGATLINLQEVDSWLYFQGLLEEYYSEDEEPEWQDYYVTDTAVYAVCDRVFLNSEGERSSRMARDYYTVWNGDLVQVMVVFNETDREKAVNWTEDFLASWKNAE